MPEGSVHIPFDKWSTSRINASVRSCLSNDPEGLASKSISSVLDLNLVPYEVFRIQHLD